MRSVGAVQSYSTHPLMNFMFVLRAYLIAICRHYSRERNRTRVRLNESASRRVRTAATSRRRENTTASVLLAACCRRTRRRRRAACTALRAGGWRLWAGRGGTGCRGGARGSPWRPRGSRATRSPRRARAPPAMCSQ